MPGDALGQLLLDLVYHRAVDHSAGATAEECGVKRGCIASEGDSVRGGRRLRGPGKAAAV